MPQPHTGELVPSGQQLWTFDSDGNLIVATQLYTGGVPDPTKPGPGQPLVPGNLVLSQFPGGGGTLDWITVKAAPYSAQGNFSTAAGTGTDDTAAIEAAVNACPAGGVVYFPNGLYLVSSPISIPNGVTLLGPVRANQAAASDSPLGAVLVPATDFPGQGTYPISAVLQCFGSSVTGLPAGTPTVSSYVRVINIGVSRISGRSLTNEVDGIAAYGNVDGGSILGCFVFGMENNVALYNDSTDGVAPDGWELMDIVTANAGNYDFNVFCADLTCINCHVQESDLGNGGWYLVDANGNNRLIGCRSDSSAGPGFTLVGPNGTSTGTNSGFSDSLAMIGCGTQNNKKQAVLILDAYTGGSTPAPGNVLIDGCSFDQDGGGGGSGTDYAAIEVNGLQIVKITGTNVNVDTAGGAAAGGPQYAIKTSASASGGRVPILVSVEHSLLGCSVQPFDDAAPSANWYVGSGVQTYIGEHTSHMTAANVGKFPQHSWTPAELGYQGFPFDTSAMQTGANRALTLGALTLIGVQIRKPCIVSKIDYYVAAAASGATTAENFVSLYNSAGTLLGYSADQTTNFGSTGFKTATLTAETTGSLSLQPGLYWIGVLTNASTTAVSLASASPNLAAQVANGQATAANARHATNGAALTALPTSITPANNVLALAMFWAAVY
jgi:hypothetical protein